MHAQQLGVGATANIQQLYLTQQQLEAWALQLQQREAQLQAREHALGVHPPAAPEPAPAEEPSVDDTVATLWRTLAAQKESFEAAMENITAVIVEIAARAVTGHATQAMTEHYSDVTMREKQMAGRKALGELAEAHTASPEVSTDDSASAGDGCWGSEETPAGWFERECRPPAGQTWCN